VTAVHEVFHEKHYLWVGTGSKQSNNLETLVWLLHNTAPLISQAAVSQGGTEDPPSFFHQSEMPE
jgi:hypothetical protein